MISAKFTIATGPYQNIKLTIDGDTVEQFADNLAKFDDSMKASLGTFMAESESWARGVYETMAQGDLDAAQKLIQDALGASVVEVVERPSEPPQDSVTAPPEGKLSERAKPASTKPQPWKAKAITTTDDGDDW